VKRIFVLVCDALRKRGIDVRELLRFGLVGGANTLLSYCVYSAFIFAGAKYYLALVFDYLFAIFFSLVANKYFTFRTTAPINFGTFAKMVGSYCCMFILNEIMLHVLIAMLGIDAYLGQAFATVVIAMLSFFMQKFIVFR
jgi:putative flippase GtrA